MIYINNGIFTDKLTKKVGAYGRFLIAFIILLCLFITYPLITGFVYMGTLFFGPQVSYLAGGIVANLYVPLLATLGGMLLFIAVKFLFLNLSINKKLLNIKVNLPNPHFKEVLVILIFVAATVALVSHSLITELNLIQDIPYLVHSNFAVIEGTATLYESSHGDTDETLMMVNGVKMDGGLAYIEKLVDNAKYHVEYLPHSRYVVKYHRIPQ